MRAGLVGPEDIGSRGRQALCGAGAYKPPEWAQLSCSAVLAGLVTADDTIAVVGSSHSAVLVLMNLLNMEPGPKVVNLYRSPLQYARFVDGGPPDGYIVRDNTGLKARLFDMPAVLCRESIWVRCSASLG